MIPVKYWDTATWLTLTGVVLNAFFFATTLSILSLIFGITCGIGFIMNVTK